MELYAMVYRFSWAKFAARFTKNKLWEKFQGFCDRELIYKGMDESAAQGAPKGVTTTGSAVSTTDLSARTLIVSPVAILQSLGLRWRVFVGCSVTEAPPNLSTKS